MKVERKDDEIGTFEDLIAYLEKLAEEFSYLDEFPFLITSACKKAFIVINPQEFEELKRRVIGDA